jgi:hypothetical protein
LRTGVEGSAVRRSGRMSTPRQTADHYLTGEEGVVEIESDWTARKRERMCLVPRVKLVTSTATFGDND